MILPSESKLVASGLRRHCSAHTYFAGLNKNIKWALDIIDSAAVLLH